MIMNVGQVVEVTNSRRPGWQRRNRRKAAARSTTRLLRERAREAIGAHLTFARTAACSGRVRPGRLARRASGVSREDPPSIRLINLEQH